MSSGRFSLENKGNSVLNFGSLKAWPSEASHCRGLSRKKKQERTLPPPRENHLENSSRSLGNGVRKKGVCNRVRIDDVGSILKFRIGFPFGENSAAFCRSVWLPKSILNFRIGSVSSMGGSIAATLFADTVSDSQIFWPPRKTFQAGGRFKNPIKTSIVYSQKLSRVSFLRKLAPSASESGPEKGGHYERGLFTWKNL